jgi:hypothetical protein
MKKLFVITLIGTLFSISGYSQDQERYNIIRVMEDLALNKQSYYTPSRTEGAPYINKNFLPALVGTINKNAVMRYDVYKDEFEFINEKQDTLVLNKAEPFTSVTFSVTGIKYQLVDYTTSKGKAANGYLILLSQKNNLTLFKKQNITFAKERIAKSGYDKDTPARFERLGDTYYLKDGDKAIVEFPTNKKGLLKSYPEKKTEIETFIKQNKIDLEKESDVIKMIEFLSV